MFYYKAIELTELTEMRHWRDGILYSSPPVHSFAFFAFSYPKAVMAQIC